MTSAGALLASVAAIYLTFAAIFVGQWIKQGVREIERRRRQGQPKVRCRVRLGQ